MGRAPDQLQGCRPSTDVILSNVEIHTALDDGRLIIDREPSPPGRASKHSECPYQNHMGLEDTEHYGVSRYPNAQRIQPDVILPVPLLLIALRSCLCTQRGLGF